MKFDELTKSVIALWSFLAYPIGEILALSGIARVVWGPGPFQRLSGFITTHASVVNNPPMHAMMDTYGITKLLPIVSLVIITLSLYLFSRVIATTMNMLPPQFLTRSPHILQAVDDETKSFLWIGLRANGIHELESQVGIVVEEARAKKSWIVEQYLTWPEKRLDAAHFRFSFLKLLILWTLICVVFSRPMADVQHTHVGSALMIVTALLLALITQFLLIIQYSEMALAAKFRVARALLQSKEDFGPPELSAIREKQTEVVLESTFDRWWGFTYFGDGIISHWKNRRERIHWGKEYQDTVRKQRLAKIKAAANVQQAESIDKDFSP
ncbi:hypothetical protein [Terriglobus roseus]|uniref:Uncharacterized protein n=1 Tax=Terriglobus roseus TaxID=392734 RepID=A0A1G7KMU9_9BACT|nr:hypothetical protein [Terriglobus roseus]SDF38099.1 hypothetical protein SAMN05444167_2233 [Terriglobus roseus]